MCSRNRAAFSFVVNLIIPGTPTLSLVSVFVNEHHPSILGERPRPGAADCDWQPFDFALHRCAAPSLSLAASCGAVLSASLLSAAVAHASRQHTKHQTND